jgi:hypothetical protein
MIEKLKQCRQIEKDLSASKPCTIEDMTYALAPLYKRGLVDVKKKLVDNKVLHCVFVTKDGIDFLEKLESHS